MEDALEYRRDSLASKNYGRIQGVSDNQTGEKLLPHFLHFYFGSARSLTIAD